MPYQKAIWACSNCGKTFKSYDEAYKHEDRCDKCKHCEHAYYVYGCEFACRFNDNLECSQASGYPRFKKEKKNG